MRKHNKVGYIEAGAKGSAPWTLHLLVPPYNPKHQRVDGMCVAALTFDGKRYADSTGSAALAKTFRVVHSPDDTEYAGIHWYDQWERLNYTDYNPAVTYTPMFAGVVWANFLGPGHIDQFDKERLSNLPAACCAWIGERGLFLIDDVPLTDAGGPAAQLKFRRMTDIFRSARSILTGDASP